MKQLRNQKITLASSLLVVAVQSIWCQPPKGIEDPGSQTATTKAVPADADPTPEQILNKPEAQRVITSFEALADDVKEKFLATVKDGRVDCVAAGPAVQKYVEQTFGKEGPSYAQSLKSPSRFHAIVHVYAFPDPGKDSYDGCWFVAAKTGPGTFSLSTKTRIQGSDNVAVASILLGLPAGLTNEGTRTVYWAVVKKKLPSNWQHVRDAFKLTAAKVQAKSTAVYHGFGPIPVVDVPSDILVVPVAVDDNGKAKSLVKKPFVVDNEGRHLWDVSAGIPVTKATGLEYAENSSSFTAKAVNKQTLFAMFNVIPFGCTTKGCSFRGDLADPKEFRLVLPLVGVGVTGRPGDRFFAGGGIGIGITQLFVGTAITSKEYKSPGDSIVRQRHRTNLAFGVNIPIGEALKKVAGSK